MTASQDKLRPPRALIITSNFWPERTGIGQVNTELAQFLARNGIEVEVVAASPYYPEWRIYPGYRARLSVREMLGDIRINRSWHYATPNPGAFGRVLHEMTLALFAIPNLIRALAKPACVFIVSPDLSFAYVASLVARLRRAPYTLIVQDVMPDAAIELKMLRNTWLIAISKAMARTLYNGATEIRTLGQGMRRRIAALTNDPAKVRISPNAIRVSELSPSNGAGAPFRKRFVPDGVFPVVHSGNMGQKQDLGVLLDAAQELKNEPDVHFYVFGDGAVKDDFLRELSRRGLGNVSHFDFQDRDMVSHMLHGAGAVIVSQLPEVVDIVVPSKLQVAMAAGAMIIAACAADSETARMLTESDGGLIVPASDGKALAAAIVSVKKGSVDVAGLRARACSYACRMFDEESVYGELARDIVSSAGTSVRSLSYKASSE